METAVKDVKGGEGGSSFLKILNFSVYAIMYLPPFFFFIADPAKIKGIASAFACFISGHFMRKFKPFGNFPGNSFECYYRYDEDEDVTVSDDRNARTEEDLEAPPSGQPLTLAPTPAEEHLPSATNPTPVGSSSAILREILYSEMYEKCNHCGELKVMKGFDVCGACMKMQT